MDICDLDLDGAERSLLPSNPPTETELLALFPRGAVVTLRSAGTTFLADVHRLEADRRFVGCVVSIVSGAPPAGLEVGAFVYFEHQNVLGCEYSSDAA